MPRLPRRKRSTSRLNLEMSTKVRRRIERLRDEMDADSLSEVIRRALAVYELLHTERSRNHGQPMIRYPDGSEKDLVLESDTADRRRAERSAARPRRRAVG